MKQSKKILALLLALMTLTTVLPAQAAGGNINQMIHQRFWTNKDMGVNEVTSKFMKDVKICYSEDYTIIARGTCSFLSNNKVQTKLKPTQDYISSVVGKNASGMVYGAKVAPRAFWGANSTAEIKYDSNCKQYWFGIQFWGTCFGSSTAPAYSKVYPIFSK